MPTRVHHHAPHRKASRHFLFSAALTAVALGLAALGLVLLQQEILNVAGFGLFLYGSLSMLAIAAVSLVLGFWKLLSKAPR